MRYELTVAEIEVLENALVSYIAHLENEYGKDNEEFNEQIADAQRILDKVNPED